MASNLSLIQFGPAILTEFSAYPESDQFGADTALIIDMTIGSPIPCSSLVLGCFVTITMPYRNPYSTSIFRETVFDHSRLACYKISGVTSTEIDCQIHVD